MELMQHDEGLPKVFETIAGAVVEKANDDTFFGRGNETVMVNILKAMAGLRLAHDDFVEVILEGLEQNFEQLDITW